MVSDEVDEDGPGFIDIFVEVKNGGMLERDVVVVFMTDDGVGLRPALGESFLPLHCFIANIYVIGQKYSMGNNFVYQCH